MAERSRVTNISSGSVPLPAGYGGKLIPPGGSEILADTNANVIAAFGGAHAVAGVVRVEFVPDSVPATVAALAAVPAAVQAAIDAGDADTLAAAGAAADAGDAAVTADFQTADTVVANAAQAYADGAASAALSAAETHADTAAAAAETAAAAYTDAAVAAVPAAVVRYQPAMYWTRDNVAAGLTQASLVTNVPNFVDWPTPRAGSVVGIIMVTNDVITAGSLTLEISIGGGAPGVHSAVYDSVTRPGGGAVLFTAGQIPYGADDIAKVLITTTGDFAPAGSMEIRVFLIVQEAP